MKTAILCFLLVLVGCGGDSGDSADSQSATLYCEHDGDIYYCENGVCERDESADEVLVEDEVGGETVMRRAVKLDGNNIYIIAECGSSVVFQNEEEVNTVEVVTEVTGNLGVNE